MGCGRLTRRLPPRCLRRACLRLRLRLLPLLLSLCPLSLILSLTFSPPPSLSQVGFVVDKAGVRLFVAGLSDSSSKVQTAAVNMLNLAVSQPDLSMRAKAALSEDSSLVPSLMALLDHTLLVLRAKAVVAILLLCR
jgi:hypothetical protein